MTSEAINRPTEVWTERVLALLVIAVTLAAVDQWVKFTVPTPAWALHHRSDLWFAGSCLLLLAALPLARVPSNAVLVAAGTFCGGVLGNLLSAGADGLDVPNPLLIGSPYAGIAFNMADAFILAGNLMLMASLIVVAIRYRDQLAACRQAHRQRLRRVVRRDR